mmetsp:Transcript_67305/g.161354  ORF Transcript_67305/g.161354 Transcript_67305/m.161354 type:complete len:308 (-) Transcript_67305:21-944(-)
MAATLCRLGLTSQGSSLFLAFVSLLALPLAAAVTSTEYVHVAVLPDDSTSACDGSGTAWGELGYRILRVGRVNSCYAQCDNNADCNYVQHDGQSQTCHLYKDCVRLRACGRACGKTVQKVRVADIVHESEVQAKRSSILRAITAQQVRLSHMLDDVSGELNLVATRANRDNSTLSAFSEGVSSVESMARNAEGAVEANSRNLNETLQLFSRVSSTAVKEHAELATLASHENEVNRTQEAVQDVVQRMDTGERTFNMLRPQLQDVDKRLRALNDRVRHNSLRGLLAEETDSMMMRLYGDMGAAWATAK